MVCCHTCSHMISQYLSLSDEILGNIEVAINTSVMKCRCTAIIFYVTVIIFDEILVDTIR